MNITIRAMHPGDIPAGLDLCRASRWNQLAEDWHMFLDSPRGGGHIAESGGQAVGTVAFLCYGRFSWLSMMLVDPAARRAGLGSRLMQAVLETLASERCIRLDATPLGEPLYRRFGFSEEYELVRTTITAPSGPAPDGVRQMAASDIPLVFERDRREFAADRSTLLESFFRRAPDLAWTAWRGDALVGYSFGRPGHLYCQIGPVVADDRQTAEKLLTACLSQKAGETLALDVPRRAWSPSLEALGFRVERPFVRMYRGETPPAAGDSQFAIAGPEFG